MKIVNLTGIALYNNYPVGTLIPKELRNYKETWINYNKILR